MITVSFFYDLSHMRNMVALVGIGVLYPSTSESCHGGLELIHWEEVVLVTLDECSQFTAVRNERVWQVFSCLYCAVPDEDNDVNQISLIESGKRGETFDVFIVLAKWILELVFSAVDRLSPRRTIRVSENPAFHVLGFDHEHTERGEYDMVDLGCATCLIGNHYIIQNLLDFRT